MLIELGYLALLTILGIVAMGLFIALAEWVMSWID